jgi:hypothetical protein
MVITTRTQNQLHPKFIHHFLTDKCDGPDDPGPCKNFSQKWRYEPITKKCLAFSWGGCEGNYQNRFDTEADCIQYCSTDEISKNLD